MAFEDMNGRKAHQFGFMAGNQAINATVDTDGNKSIHFAHISEAEPTDHPARPNMAGECGGGKRQRESHTIPQQKRQL